MLRDVDAGNVLANSNFVWRASRSSLVLRAKLLFIYSNRSRLIIIGSIGDSKVESEATAVVIVRPFLAFISHLLRPEEGESSAVYTISGEISTCRHPAVTRRHGFGFPQGKRALGIEY